MKATSPEGKKFIEEHILSKFFLNTDRPSNLEDLTLILAEDVAETADPENWHSGDIDIAFRRFVEIATDLLNQNL